MKSGNKASVWIFHNLAGQIYAVKVVKDGDVTEFPVTNSSRKSVVSAMRGIFGRVELTDVYEVPNDAREC